MQKFALLCIYAGIKTYIPKNVHMNIHNSFVHKIVPKWKQPIYPLIDKCLNCGLSLSEMLYQALIKSNKLLTHTTAWMDLKVLCQVKKPTVKSHRLYHDKLYLQQWNGVCKLPFLCWALLKEAQSKVLSEWRFCPENISEDSAWLSIHHSLWKCERKID